MKKTIATILLFILVTTLSLAQENTCISGDCENGYGVYKLINGDKYEGNWKDNKWNGEGTLYRADGTKKYEGNFKDGLFNGEGTLYYPNGAKYVGNFKDDLYNGEGTLYFANGDKYIGNFKDDLYNGKGTFYLANGNRYSGKFKDNKPQNGAVYNSNGTKLGEVKNGVPVEN